MMSNKEPFRKLFNNKQQLQSGKRLQEIACKAHVLNEYMSSPTEPSLYHCCFSLSFS
jgi:hypothetical protein